LKQNISANKYIFIYLCMYHAWGLKILCGATSHLMDQVVVQSLINKHFSGRIFGLYLKYILLPVWLYNMTNYKEYKFLLHKKAHCFKWWVFATNDHSKFTNLAGERGGERKNMSASVFYSFQERSSINRYIFTRALWRSWKLGSRYRKMDSWYKNYFITIFSFLTHCKKKFEQSSYIVTVYKSLMYFELVRALFVYTVLASNQSKKSSY